MVDERRQPLVVEVRDLPQIHHGEVRGRGHVGDVVRIKPPPAAAEVDEHGGLGRVEQPRPDDRVRPVPAATRQPIADRRTLPLAQQRRAPGRVRVDPVRFHPRQDRVPPPAERLPGVVRPRPPAVRDPSQGAGGGEGAVLRGDLLPIVRGSLQSLKCRGGDGRRGVRGEQFRQRRLGRRGVLIDGRGGLADRRCGGERGRSAEGEQQCGDGGHHGGFRGRNGGSGRGVSGRRAPRRCGPARRPPRRGSFGPSPSSKLVGAPRTTRPRPR